MAGNLKITMRKSMSGRSEKQRKILTGLGLRKMHQTVVHPDNPSIRGMISKLDFMLEVVEG
jgi:large subunit ribosomal protein L30